MPTRLVFMGAKPIGLWCLEHAISRRDELDLEIAGVLSKDNANITHRSLNDVAREHGIPVLTSLDDLLDTPDVDLLVSVQYHEIIRAHHIEHARRLAVNLHMAPLPEYRGCNQFSFAILDDKEVFGTTLHVMDPGIDSGAILFERRFEVPAGTDVATLYDMTDQHSRVLWEERLADLVRGTYTPTDQSEFVAERGTSIHYRREINEIKRIDPTWAPERILRHLRATYMPQFAPPFMEIDGVRIDLVPHWPDAEQE